MGKSQTLSWSESVSECACTREWVVCVHVCALFDIKAKVVFFLHFISHIPNDAASPSINSEVRKNRFFASCAGGFLIPRPRDLRADKTEN